MTRIGSHILRPFWCLLLAAFLVAPAEAVLGQICGRNSKGTVIDILERLAEVRNTSQVKLNRFSSDNDLNVGLALIDDDSLTFDSDSVWVRLKVTGDTEGKIVLGPPGLAQRTTKTRAERGGYRLSKNLGGGWQVASRESVGGAVSVELEKGCLLIKWLDAVVSIFGTELVARADGDELSVLANGCIAINEPYGDHPLQPKLEWFAPDAGSVGRYVVDIVRGSPDEVTNHTWTDDLVYSDTTTDTNATSLFVTQRLAPGTDYTWRVGAENPAREMPRWSDLMTFATAELNPPRLIYPRNSDQGLDLNPVFEWTEEPEFVADYYVIELRAPNQKKFVRAVYSDSRLRATFADRSLQRGNYPIRSWSWDFGDGGTSSEENPSHTFAAAGTYDVVLKVTDENGAASEIMRSVTVSRDRINLPPEANFSFASSRLRAKFDDRSRQRVDRPIRSWSWDFGDGNTSTEQNPLHTFSNAGTYNVTLKVTDSDDDSDEIMRTVTVAKDGINRSPEANFSFNTSRLDVVFVRPDNVERGTTTYRFSEELSLDTRYMWRVRGMSQDKEGAWSPWWEFRTKSQTDSLNFAGEAEDVTQETANEIDSDAAAAAGEDTLATPGETPQSLGIASGRPGAPTPVSPGVLRNRNECKGDRIVPSNARAALEFGTLAASIVDGYPQSESTGWYLPTNRVGRDVGFKVVDRNVIPITDKEELDGLSDLLDEMNVRKWGGRALPVLGAAIVGGALVAWALRRHFVDPRSSATVVVGGPK